MSYTKFVAVVFLLASAVVQANQCSRDGECPSDGEPQNGVSLLQTTLQTNVINDVKNLARVEVEEPDAMEMMQKASSHDRHLVALFQTNLQMNVLKGSTHAAAMQEDLNPQPNSRTSPSSPVKPTNKEEFWSISTFKASFITATSGAADSVVVAAKLRQSVLIAILLVPVIGVALAALWAWPVLSVLIFPSLYICISAFMIETNKWLMLPGHFPFPLTLATNHMVTSWLLASGLSRICPSAFPALEKIEVTWLLRLKFVPIGAAFASSMVCGNAAYQFLSVPILQCMKQSNIVVIYTLSVLCGLELLRRCSIILLFGIFCGTMLAVQGELHFVLVGFVFQVVSSLSEATKIILQFMLMSGAYKLDPLTMVLFMAPACLFANVIPFLILEAPRSSEIITQLHLLFPMLIFSGMLAFSLNIVVAQCIRQLSPVGFLLSGIVKDVSIIVTSCWFLGESLAPQQVVGMIVALSGVASYSLYKQNLDCFEDEHLLQGFSRVAERLFGLKQDKSQSPEELAKGDSK